MGTDEQVEDFLDVEEERFYEDLEIDVVGKRLKHPGTTSNTLESYKASLEEYMEELRESVREKDQVYDIEMLMSEEKETLLREAWIFYRNEE